MSLEAPVALTEVEREVARLLAGDPEGFQCLLARYQNRLYRFLLRLSRNPAVAEDLFQQTWLRVIENIRRYDRRRSFEAWLFTLARNLAIDHLRAIRPQSLDDAPPAGKPPLENLHAEGPSAFERVRERERSEWVVAALEAQPAEYREVLSLRFEEEMKLEEIAEVTGLPLGTVKSRLRRGLERMRASLARTAPEEHCHERA
jgi:RNA polymerase sigma-70 factor (ECF subfamily)